MDWPALLADRPTIDLLLPVLALAAMGWSGLAFAWDCRQYRRWIAQIEADGVDG